MWLRKSIKMNWHFDLLVVKVQIILFFPAGQHIYRKCKINRLIVPKGQYIHVQNMYCKHSYTD